MAKSKPTHAQAQLHLQLYDLRREEKMRQAREWFMQNYFPQQPEDMQRLAPPGSKENAFMRMVLSYWDQACLLLNYGLLHEEMFFKTTNEFFLVWERIKPFVPGIRERLCNPYMFENLEQASQRYQKRWEQLAPGYLEAVRQFVQQARKPAAAR